MKVAAVTGEKGQVVEVRVCGRAACEGPSSPRSEGLSLAPIQIVFCLRCGSKVPRVSLQGTACIFGSCCCLVTGIWIVLHVIFMFLNAF